MGVAGLEKVQKHPPGVSAPGGVPKSSSPKRPKDCLGGRPKVNEVELVGQCWEFTQQSNLVLIGGWGDRSVPLIRRNFMTYRAQMQADKKQRKKLLKLPAVLEKFPVGRSSWYAGVKSGIYPAGIKLGSRAVAWDESLIDDLIESLAAGSTSSVE